MTTLTSLARAEAVRAGRAQPIATVRHVHRHHRPLVLIPLALAGEANAPLAAMIGDDRAAPVLLVVPQPRNRDLRFAFAAELADLINPYLYSFASTVEAVAAERGKEIRVRYADAPQLVIPNRGGIGFVKLLGRSTRFRRTEGEYAVKASVPELGRWLTFLGERSEHPGSSMLVAATDLLATHWATGQSSVEDQNLAALLGWIDPPDGHTGASAAAAAEDARNCPPAGPATDPDFDNQILAPLIRTGDIEAIEQALAGQLRPTWDLVWRGLDHLDTLAAGNHVATRWDEDKDAFTAYHTYVQDLGLPQPRRDHAVAAAARLHRLERAQARYAVQRALDDPLIFAEHRLAGEAFMATVTIVDPDRFVGEGRSRVLRPLLTVQTDDVVRLTVGASLTSVGRPHQKARIVSSAGGNIVLELSGGMGRSRTPEPGVLPRVGEWVAYTSITDTYQMSPTFPVVQDTPWTHGGPPAAYEPSADDAREVWE